MHTLFPISQWDCMDYFDTGAVDADFEKAVKQLSPRPKPKRPKPPKP
ncbi:MAG: hypothetical protein WCT12_17260 [Verrucomicrobiota bacterium]